MDTCDNISDRHVSAAGDDRSLEGGALNGSSAEKQTSRRRSDARSVDAQMKEALRLWAKNGRLTKAERLAALEASRGMWKNQPEWKGMSSTEIAAELRRRSMRRGKDV